MAAIAETVTRHYGRGRILETDTARAWLEARLAQPAPVLGIHLLMGANGRARLENVVRNLAEGRIAVLQAVVQKGG